MFNALFFINGYCLQESRAFDWAHTVLLGAWHDHVEDFSSSIQYSSLSIKESKDIFYQVSFVKLTF